MRSSARRLAALAIFAALAFSAPAGARADEFDDDGPGTPKPAPPARYAAIESPSLLGPSGLLRVAAAGGGRKGVVHVQLLVETLRATQFLAQSPFDTHWRTGLRLAAAWTPAPWLEVFALLAGESNTNTRDTPRTHNTVGDTTLGAKACLSVTPAWCVGGEAALLLFVGAQRGAFTADALSGRLRALATLDVRSLAPRVPLRVHVNAGVLLDNTKAYARGEYTQATRFALHINEGSRAQLGLGVDAPLHARLTAFAEWNLEIPLGDLPNTTRPQGFAAYPHTVATGVRLSPWPLFSVLLAVELGLTSRGQLGLPAVPPWQAFFGAVFHLGTGAR